MSPVAYPIEEDMAMWAAAIQQNVTNTYVCASMICILLYDVLIKLDKEIEHVWETRWSTSTVIFIFARYYGLIYIIAEFAVFTTVGLSSQLYVSSRKHGIALNYATESGYGSCRGWLWVLLLAGDVPVATIVSVILTMRLYTMYPNRIALVFFVSLTTCQLVLELYSITTIGIQASVVSVPTGVPLPGCIVTYPSLTLSLIAHILCALIATAFFVIAIMRIAASWRSTSEYLTNIKFLSPLIVLIVRDGALFYFLLCVILIFNIIAIKVPVPLNPFMLVLLRVTAYSWSGSRLVLNLREAMNRTYVNASTLVTQTMTTPVFAPNPMLGQTQGTVNGEYRVTVSLGEHTWAGI